ncbi:DUF1801 domain-containing protein [Parvibaculaceae bacterium PLY_AMNH_Bact1]|nr:DUF1801 domain-containing protein [Parvibaculaceae bacterium PLY_AMNH_Bact1]
MTEKSQIPFEGDGVADVFGSYEGKAKQKLLALRGLIFRTASQTPGVGELQETLKWGQPSYLTPETKSGSTIRIDAIKDDPDHVAIYFHCQTNLVPTFRDMYGDKLTFEGNRALVLDVRKKLPEKEVRHCLASALTYHLAKKKKR